VAEGAVRDEGWSRFQAAVKFVVRAVFRGGGSVRRLCSMVVCAALLVACDSEAPLSPETRVVTTLTLSHALVELGLGSFLPIIAYPRNSFGDPVRDAVLAWSARIDEHRMGITRRRGRARW